jgi:hypothetical protein
MQRELSETLNVPVDLVSDGGLKNERLRQYVFQDLKLILSDGLDSLNNNYEKSYNTELHGDTQSCTEEIRRKSSVQLRVSPCNSVL